MAVCSENNYFKTLPKLELHAHLNGSLSRTTLKSLQLNNEKQPNSEWSENGVTFYNLNSCFDIFSTAHELTKTAEAVKLATDLTIKEFANDGVIYLEIRSTPREEETMTKQQYIQSIVDAIKENNNNNPSIFVTLLISINRSQPVKNATENVDLAIDFHNKYSEIVTGIDLSGNPALGKFFNFIPMLNLARENGLKISLHCAEIENHIETMEMIQFCPDRLGHFTKPNPDAIEKVRELKIPLELCVTSNIKCGTVESAAKHHFGNYYENHPIILCTDDKGVFGTSLTCEYELVHNTFNTSKEFFHKMNQSAIEFCFTSPSIKEKLKKAFERIP